MTCCSLDEVLLAKERIWCAWSYLRLEIGDLEEKSCLKGWREERRNLETSRPLLRPTGRLLPWHHHILGPLCTELSPWSRDLLSLNGLLFLSTCRAPKLSFKDTSSMVEWLSSLYCGIKGFWDLYMHSLNIFYLAFEGLCNLKWALLHWRWPGKRLRGSRAQEAIEHHKVRGWLGHCWFWEKCIAISTGKDQRKDHEYARWEHWKHSEEPDQKNEHLNGTRSGGAFQFCLNFGGISTSKRCPFQFELQKIRSRKGYLSVSEYELQNPKL